MCLIFFALDVHKDYKLVLAGNRDEFYKRKTASAAFWEEHPHILAGRDLEGMGTWLGVNRQGKISMLTNYRDVANLKSSAPSRGKLVSDYLVDDIQPEAYLSRVAESGALYNGFNLLTGTADALWYYSNYANRIQKLSNGVFGLSNHLLDTPWPKVHKGKSRFASIVDNSEIDKDDLFSLLYNEELASDNALPDTGLSRERERALSAMFIKTPDYGSRSSTVILIGRDNRLSFSERVYNPATFEYVTQSFEFTISP
jgi:uncharacterized protein with NRDE domain